jgi:hypothetical protein
MGYLPIRASAIGMLFFALVLMASDVYGEPTPSGADSLKVYLDTDQATLGGDSVNIAINILNAEGKVNTASNGQVGDVVVKITTCWAGRFFGIRQATMD